MDPVVITDQPDLVPLTSDEQALLERLISEFERLEERIASGDPYNLAFAEQSGIRTAIAYMTGLHLISTPPGGVGDWLPTLKHILKGAQS